MENQKLSRLESLDILRGFDLLCLVALEHIFHALKNGIDTPWFNKFMWNFEHVEWQGFSPWDLVMPLFMFMAGVSIPFALSKYKETRSKTSVYKRIIKRVILLWLFGMICQGNLLGLDPERVYFYSNTLQAIAIGYLISAILFLHTNIKTQIITATVLLLIYWGAMEFITIDGFGGGSYAPNNNLAEWIDRTFLGRFRDAAQVVNGEVNFADWYRYTWVLSSLNFGVTVLTGIFAGHILKYNFSGKKKTWLLFIIGAGLVTVGWLWSLQMPIIKKIWTSSMVLVSSGYCFLLMGLFYYWIDYKGHKKRLSWLKVYGMNSILAYMVANVINIGAISMSVLFGFEQYLGNYFYVLITISNAVIIYIILWQMYKQKIFLKV